MKSSGGNTLIAIESQVRVRFARRKFVCMFKNEWGPKGQAIKLRSPRKGRRKKTVTVWFFKVIEAQTWTT